LVIEVELLSAVSAALERLGFADFTIRVNHRELLTGLLRGAGVPAPLFGDALVAIDKLDKVGRDGVRAELEARGVAPGPATACLDLLEAGFPAGLRRHVQHDERGAYAIEQLETIAELAGATAAGGHLRVDPSLARGLSYYTGPIFEAAVPDLAGSLGGGGRYDNLIGSFLGRDIPACGFSLGLERIIVVMTERSMFPGNVARGALDAMVTIWSHDTRGDSLMLASELRHAGLRVDVYPEADKLGKQLKYASSRNVPFVAVVGDDERARGEVAVKDLRTGQQHAVARAEAAAFIQERLQREV
jgi:histidyl-tRNA synthetase